MDFYYSLGFDFNGDNSLFYIPSSGFFRMGFGELKFKSLTLLVEFAYIDARDYLPCPSKVTLFGDKGGSLNAGKMEELSSTFRLGIKFSNSEALMRRVTSFSSSL
jgi:hypothetical protein